MSTHLYVIEPTFGKGGWRVVKQSPAGRGPIVAEYRSETVARVVATLLNALKGEEAES